MMNLNAKSLSNIISSFTLLQMRAVARPTVGRWVDLAFQVCFAIPLKTDLDVKPIVIISYAC